MEQIRITWDWIWVKHTLETTNVLYKACLKDWYKGTGGGPGIDKAFESWDDEMRTKYNWPNTYDHTDVVSRPIVLFQNYMKNRVPFLRMTRIWDQACNYLLSSKHDALTIGSCEIGFEDANVNNFHITIEHDQCSSRPISPAKPVKKEKRSLGQFKGEGGLLPIYPQYYPLSWRFMKVLILTLLILPLLTLLQVTNRFLM